MEAGDNIKAANASWTFGAGVAKSFDAHVSKSVPLYAEGHKLVTALSDYFVKDNSTVYEIGCSTGALTSALARHHTSREGTHFVGIDVEPEMIAEADARRGAANVTFLQADISDVDLQPSDLIVCYYTLQFIAPRRRQAVVDQLYQALNWGGALLLFEKVRAPDARFQDIATGLYHDYKLDQGYTAEEIVAKSRSLKGVLEPFSTQGNIDLMTRAGFVDVTTVLKYICFEGFLAIK